MASPLSAEEEKQYTEIIDGILATVDLETVTRKKIRMGLEAALDGKDLSSQKSAIKDLIEQRFDAVSSAAPEPAAEPSPASPDSSIKPHTNGHTAVHNAVKPEPEADEIRVQPPKKVSRKKSEDTEDADAKLAALLQAEENSRTRAATRGGGNAKSKPTNKKATPRKKSAKRVKPEDDSDVEGENGTKKRKAGGGFQKPFNLSYSLAAVCGEQQMSRPQVVKKLWEHIKANDLQDPSDKRQIRCDDAMQSVFKQSKVDMFQMNKLISNHLYPVEEEA